MLVHRLHVPIVNVEDRKASLAELTYAVTHFIANGGQQAYAVRLLFDGDETATPSIGGITLVATGPGSWAEEYGVIATLRRDDPRTAALDARTFIQRLLRRGQPRSAEQST
jgi:hypothetical protein